MAENTDSLKKMIETAFPATLLKKLKTTEEINAVCDNISTIMHQMRHLKDSLDTKSEKLAEKERERLKLTFLKDMFKSLNCYDWNGEQVFQKEVTLKLRVNFLGNANICNLLGNNIVSGEDEDGDSVYNVEIVGSPSTENGLYSIDDINYIEQNIQEYFESMCPEGITTFLGFKSKLNNMKNKLKNLPIEVQEELGEMSHEDIIQLLEEDQKKRKKSKPKTNPKSSKKKQS